MDKEKKIAEIREALSAATPGPWAVFVGEGWTEEYPRNTYVQAVWNEPDHRGSFGYRVARMAGVHGRTMADAHLIANAPEWLRFLLDELDRLRAEREAWHNSNHASSVIQRLNKERDKLIEVLHNYMKELDRRYQKAYRNYDIDCDHHQLGMAEAYEVSERRLRDILHEIGVTVE